MSASQSVEGTDVALSKDEVYTLYIGTYTRNEGHVNGKAQGIHRVIMGKSSGKMEKTSEYDAGINPSYLAIHPTKKFLYAVNEGGGRDNEEFGP